MTASEEAGAQGAGTPAEDLARWLDEAASIARDAGEGLLRAWRTGTAVTHKGAIDLVTEHDLRSEALIRERLGRAFPGHAIVAEEGAATDALGAVDPASGDPRPTWLCDPLDGTTNFAHGHFFFAVSLGVAERGIPIGGVVFAPALRTLWVGGRGLGAWRQTEGREREACRISSAGTLVTSLVATGFPYDRRTSPENNVREHSRIVLGVQGIRRCGSAALDLCLVADGTYDAYWEQKLAPWDLCAGAAIAIAAGARVTGYEGEPIHARSSRVVATNGHVHDELCREIAAARGPG